MAMRLCSLVAFLNNWRYKMNKEELKNVNEKEISENKEVDTTVDKKTQSNNDLKPLSDEGKRITKKLEEMTGIKLMDEENEEEVVHTKSNNVDNLENKKVNTRSQGDEEHLKNDKSDKLNLEADKEKKEGKGLKGKEHLQNVKDVDFGEDNANKPLIFKCSNDLRLTLKKGNGEYVIDEDCCTAISLLVKNTGEIATNFSGAHSPNLVKILEKSLKRYLKDLKKTLKKEYKIANDELTLSKDPLDEGKRWK